MLSRQRKKFSILGRCVRIIYKHWWSYQRMTDVNKLSHGVVVVVIEIPQQAGAWTW